MAAVSTCNNPDDNHVGMVPMSQTTLQSTAHMMIDGHHTRF